jgi:hypothetical protein
MRIPVFALFAFLSFCGTACVNEHDCGDRTLDVAGAPAMYAIAPGAQPEGFAVGEPLVCPDGVTTIAVSAAGTRDLADADADAFFAGLTATLAGQGVTVYGPGLTAFECSDTSRPSPYLYFLQLPDWAWADAAVRALGTGLIQEDFGATVAVLVGIPISCAV